MRFAKTLNDTVLTSADDVADRASDAGCDTVIDLGGGHTVTLIGVAVDDVRHDPSAFFQVL